jgi:chromosome segregation ATPase
VFESCASHFLETLQLGSPAVSGRRIGLLALVLAAVLVAGGCGGDDESSAESWANDVCSNLSEWLGEVDEAANSLTEQGSDFDESAVRDAVDQIRNATDELADDLGELGPPDTDAGQEAEEALDTLSSELRKQSDSLEQELDENDAPLEQASAIAASFSAVADQLNETFQGLQGLDPGGELEDAFSDSEECDTFLEEAEEVGS